MSNLIVLSLSALLVAGPAFAQTPAQRPTPPSAPASKPAHPTFESTLAEIAADPVTKAILEKHLPNITANEAWEYIKGYTLTGFAGLSQGTFTAEKLAAIEADFKALSTV